MVSEFHQGRRQFCPVYCGAEVSRRTLGWNVRSLYVAPVIAWLGRAYGHYGQAVGRSAALDRSRKMRACRINTFGKVQLIRTTNLSLTESGWAEVSIERYGTAEVAHYSYFLTDPLILGCCSARQSPASSLFFLSKDVLEIWIYYSIIFYDGCPYRMDQDCVTNHNHDTWIETIAEIRNFSHSDLNDKNLDEKNADEVMSS